MTNKEKFIAGIKENVEFILNQMNDDWLHYEHYGALLTTSMQKGMLRRYYFEALDAVDEVMSKSNFKYHYSYATENYVLRFYVHKNTYR